MKTILLSQLKEHEGELVTIRGWVFNFRSSGKIYFLQIRDGFGRIQAVVSRETVDQNSWTACEQVTLESSVIVSGTVQADARSPYGYELQVASVSLLQRAAEYPIGKKEHGVDFLLDQRHLWLRAERQRAVMRVRDEIIWAMREFFRQEQYTLTDTPILTPTACEGTTTLFETEYFDEKAYLSQSGQLYLEALAMALGKVYDFGPTFRAEKSKTRRHLMEFWMLDAEAAFVQHEENMQIQERLVTHIVQSVLTHRSDELRILERDTTALQKVAGPFVRLRYDDAVVALQKLGSDIQHGEDFGADDETMLMKQYDKPVFVTHYPTAIKAFYMQPDPENPKQVLCADLLAPEGYGEVIGGSERIWDYDLLRARLHEHKLSESDFGWYLDLRKYGSVPHAGFGIGLERTVAWLCGLDHVRETIPFPRLLNRLRP